MAEDKRPAGSGGQEQNVLPGENGTLSNDDGIINKAWNFLSSMKLGIILLLILAVASIIGTIWVPRDPFTGQPDYLKFYNNPIFNILLAFLSLNLLVCSLNRWKAIKNTLKGPNVEVSENFIKSLKSGSSFKVKSGPAETSEEIRNLLKKKGYRVFGKDAGDTYKIAADRGHLGILGPYLTHLSLFIIIVAVMIKFSGLVGFDGTFAGWEGQTYSIGQTQGIQNVDPADFFDIRINNFRTEYRPDGTEIKQWFSDVTVIDGLKTFDFSIYVNKPLVYKGMKFYQSSYGHQFSGKFSGPSAKDQQFNVAMQEYIQPAGTDLTFVPMGYEDATKEVKFRIYKGNRWVAEEEAVLNTPFKYENAEVKFENVISYTVLSAKKDPGVLIVGIGSLLLIVGIIISFILRQRRIWSVVVPEKGGSLVHIGGISAKDKHGLDTDLEEIAEELK